jgi:hypothetical protein
VILNASLPPSSTAVLLECDVLAYAAVQVPTDQIGALRRNPGPSTGKTFSPALLRFADEQTVAGIAAVLQAIHRHGLTGTDFTRWGILGAPMFLGRATVVQAILRFAKEGAWGVSPHIIPHRLLHAVSGTLSQVLGVHGPNYGVGGGPDGISEAFLTAFTLINTDDIPGLWLLLTGNDPEPTLDDQGQTVSPGVCEAIALALTRPQGKGSRLRLTPFSGDPKGSADSAPALVSQNTLRQAFKNEPSATRAAWRIDGFGTLTVEGRGGPR